MGKRLGTQLLGVESRPWGVQINDQRHGGWRHKLVMMATCELLQWKQGEEDRVEIVFERRVEGLGQKSSHGGLHGSLRGNGEATR
jgi:hypothetical protein